MKKKITIALSAFALFFFSSFQAEAGSKSDSYQQKMINQPTLQRSKDKKLSQHNKQAGQFNSNAVILSNTRLSKWNHKRTNFIGVSGQLNVSPQKRKVISNVMRKLNESDRLMQRVAELQKNPVENKSVLIKISSELRKYENQIKVLQQQLGSPLQPWNGKPKDIGDDAQLANIDLQNILQKQQQTIQMMSDIAKVFHDTAMAVIRKIG